MMQRLLLYPDAKRMLPGAPVRALTARFMTIQPMLEERLSAAAAATAARITGAREQAGTPRF